MYRVLFVCSTNFSRSPLAAALLRARLKQVNLSGKIIVDSAGAFPGFEPRNPERRTCELARAHGYDISGHRTREITQEDFAIADLIVVLDDDTYHHLRKLTEHTANAGKIRRFVEYFGDLSLTDLGDPVLGQIGFEEMFDILEKGVEQLARSLTHRHISAKKPDES
jgi:protein-tyrosine phosphatase